MIFCQVLDEEMKNDLKSDIIVIGASAGGVEALKQFVAELRPGLAAALFVTLHLPPRSVSQLPVARRRPAIR